MSRKIKLLPLLFLITIFSVFIGLIINKLSIEIQKIDNAKFEDISKNTTVWKNAEPIKPAKTQSKVRINDKINIFIDAIIPFKDEMIDLYGLNSKLIDKRIIEDIIPERTIIKHDNGQLSFFSTKSINPIALEQIIKLNNFTLSQNSKFALILSPYKNSTIGQLPYNYSSSFPDSITSFKSNLSKKNITTIDLNEYIDSTNVNRIFYNLDHHWRVETAFEMFSNLSLYFNNVDSTHFNIQKEYLNKKNYTFTKISNDFMGSLGRRVGKYYAELDSFILITPNFKTNYTAEYYRYNQPTEKKQGDFQQCLINTAPFSEGSPYDCYLSGNIPFVKIINNNATNGKVLIIKDSYAVPVICFMSTLIHEIQLIDLRYYFEDDIYDKISNENFDQVWIFYNKSSLASNDRFFPIN